MEKNNSRELREVIRLLERKLGVLQKSEVSCCGVTFAQCHAIVEIGRAGNLSLNYLAEILNLDKSTMSRTVNNLVEDGLAERETDPDDRRYVTIRLTGSGRKIFEGIEESMNLYYRKVFERLPADKRDQVLESVRLLLEAIDRHDCCK